MQSILILGAGLLQKPSILAAKHLGYKAVVIDGSKEAVCVPLADEFYNIDLKDREGILQLGKKIMEGDGLAAVFTAGTDFSASVSYAAEKLSLPCHPFEAALNASDKERMRQCFSRCNVPSPSFHVVNAAGTENTSIGSKAETAGDKRTAASGAASLPLSGGGDKAIEEALEAARRIGFPCVIKPVDNMGARGCRMVRSEGEVRRALEDALSSSRSSRAIIEEYMEGDEYSIDALVFDGEVTVTGFADRHIYWPPYFIETGHTMPTIISEDKKAALIETFAKGIEVLGLTHGAAKADIKWTAKGAMIGEIAARLSGGYMSGWTYPYASRLNLTEQALLVACGKKPRELISLRKLLRRGEKEKGSTGDNAQSIKANSSFSLYDYPCSDFCAERAWISIPGTVKKVIGLDEAAGTEGVRNVFPRAKEGDEVDFPRNNVQKCGNIIAVAPTRDKAVKAAEDAASRIVIYLTPNNKKTDAFLTANGAGEERGEEGFPPWAYKAGEAAAKEVAMLDGVLSAKDKALEHIPHCLESLAKSNEKDFNRRTLKETLFMFDKLCSGRTCDLKESAFYLAVLRGGLQGAIYAAECAR